jgi:hypothetical protein
VTDSRDNEPAMRLYRRRMDAIDDHLDWIRGATARDWNRLLDHFAEQCDPLSPSELKPVRPGRIPDEEWESSTEFQALARMLGRCWPTETAQNQ